MVGYCKHLVGRARHEVAIIAPVTVNDLLAMLGDAGDLPLTLPVEEGQTG